MKRLKSVLPGIVASRHLVASVCFIGAAALGGCAGEDGTEDDATGGSVGDGDATGGTTASGGGTGSGGTTSSGGTGPDPNEMPSDTSAEGIAAFLEAGTYQSSPWVGDPAPRGTDNVVNVHGAQMRVFFNSAAVAAVTNDTSAAGTMVVKELYEAGAVVGHAVSIKTGSGNTANDWLHYCNAPVGSTACTGESVNTMPIYAVGVEAACGYCHGQVPYAPLPQ